MKVYWTLVLVILALATGCDTLPNIFGKSSQSISKQEQKIERVDDKLSSINKQKLEDIAVLASGTQYSLTKVTNPPQAVIVAKDINARVISEAGYTPTIEKLKQMQLMIDNLITTNKIGVQLLSAKDKEIEALLQSEKSLLLSKDVELSKLNELAKKIASQNDTTQNELSKYQSYWGLGGVFLGLKSFSLHIMWYGIAFTIIFIVLRVLSYSNPLAAILFGVFQSIGATIIHLIEMAIPQSIGTIDDTKKAVNNVADAIHNGIK